ncbi:hypothetical protein JMJ55_28210 [Belnapia sp. T6]|uniref:XRE family transcriptional regulator n=1 Tax=Belnapia mucosa TaxID=2804532 RepID=A0ABS1VC13_9PROT|nr:hypothetical protein [Belnapia mucosa]MBL6459211.1 hypothetical protein [Belnapia mucosa]
MIPTHLGFLYQPCASFAGTNRPFARRGLVLVAAAPDICGMSLPPPDQMLPAKPRITSEKRRRRTADQLRVIRLRMAIGRELDNRGIMTPAGIGAALGILPAEATSLLNRKQWREGDVALLEAAAARLGVQVPEPARDDWPS